MYKLIVFSALLAVASADYDAAVITSVWPKIFTQDFGIGVMSRLFKVYPDYVNFFPEDMRTNILENENFHKHVISRVLGALGKAIDDLPNAEKMLLSVGTRHKGRFPSADVFKTFKQPFLEELEARLNADFTPAVKENWNVFLDAALDYLVNGYNS